MDMIKEIITLEWDMFHNVNSGKRRASCQNNRIVFSAMRGAQFWAWPQQACLSYLETVKRANVEGRNLIEEKYIRMMEHFAPDEYRCLADHLPAVSEAQRNDAMEICEILVKQMQELYRDYPFLSAVSRPLRASENSATEVSYETYQLGELLTYSEETLSVLKKYLLDLERKQISMCRMIQENTVKAEGYHNLDEAEEAARIRARYMDSRCCC